MKLNVSPGAKISWQLVQKWPRNKTKITKKNQKWTLKNVFFSKIPQNFEFWNKFLNPHIKPVFLAGTNILGHLFCPKVPSRAMCHKWDFVFSKVRLRNLGRKCKPYLICDIKFSLLDGIIRFAFYPLKTLIMIF